MTRSSKYDWTAKDTPKLKFYSRTQNPREMDIFAECPQCFAGCYGVSVGSLVAAHC